MAYHSPGEPLKIDTIATRAQVPPRFLEQIFQDLKKVGLVGSKRGPKGGYFLTMPTDKITLRSVICAVEGDLRHTLCRDAPEAEAGDPQCGSVTQALWQEVAERIGDILAGISLADLVARSESLGVPREGYKRFTYVI
jgi:Rrf2 family protein